MEDEMGGSCSTHGREAYNILAGQPEGKNHLEDLGKVGKILLEWILGK
jgi:hypothetical protein